MWRAGLDIALVAWLANAGALVFGLVLGARALLDPHWAARLVRLAPDPARPGGQAEFRATYGGFFLGAHGVALALSATWILGGSYENGVYATAAGAALAAGWGATAAGRILAMWRDDARTDFNMISAAIEASVALAIGAPLIVWLMGWSR